MKYKQIWKTAAACLMAAVMLPGCSDEEGGGTVNPEDKYRTLVVSINSRSNAEPVGTRAETVVTDEENDEEYERHIDKWWLLVTKPAEGEGNYTIDRVITSDNYNTLEDITVSGPTGLDSEMQIGLEVEIGETYEFFAMANLNHLENWDTEVKAQVEAWNNSDATFSPAALNAEMKGMTEYTGETYIPMTSYGYTQTITEGTTELETGPIELIRLLGKVTLNVTNLTGSTIELQSLSMGDFRSTGDIYLFPYDVNGGTNYLLREDILKDYNPSFPSNTEDFSSTPFVSTATNIESGEDNAQSFVAYVNETGNGNGDFTITSVIPGRNSDPINSGFSFVRRNDWLQIPIQITDVDVTINFDQQHSPIGGTPGSVNIPEGAQIPIGTCITEHGGDITVTFTLNSVSSMENAYLSFYSGSDWMSGTQFTDAILISNTSDADNEEPILINLPAAGNTNVPWEATDVVAFPITYTGEQPTSGSFTVTAQELAESTTGRAEIELTLVITNGTQEMAIPYTIVITNKTTN